MASALPKKQQGGKTALVQSPNPKDAIAFVVPWSSLNVSAIPLVLTPVPFVSERRGNLLGSVLIFVTQKQLVFAQTIVLTSEKAVYHQRVTGGTQVIHVSVLSSKH